MSDDEQAVLRANAAFYEAFTHGDLEAMDALWSQRAPVACVHPGWDALHGRAAVLRSWHLIFQGPRPPRVTAERATVQLLGDVAYVLCHERLRDAAGEVAGTLVATNLFVREPEGWKLVLHHAGPTPVADAPTEEAEPSAGAGQRGTGGRLN